jgi:phage terminase large subunit-like protein
MPNNLIAEIAKEFISGNTEDVVDIVSFVEAPWGLNIKLMPVQKFILRCFYGLPLNGTDKNISVPDVTNEKVLYTFTEKDFLKWLYAEGRANTDDTEGRIFQEVVLAVGRRGTKSTLASCVSNYELYKLVKRGDPSKFYGFPSHTQIAILNVAPTDEQSGIVFDMTQSMAMRCPYMKDRSLHQTMTYFDLRSDADLKVIGKPKASLISIAGGCSSNSLRGRNGIVVIMDEMAHFIDNNGRFSGSEVYRALTPSIANFRRDGKIICISSPYAKFGSFYERYVQSYQEKDFTLMFKMYSAMVNPTIPSEILRAARRRDRVGFTCEYGGEFSDTVTAWIEDESEFKKCVVDRAMSTRGVHDVQYYVGVDLGFKNDGTAVAVVHRDDKTGKIVLDYANVWYSGSSDIWEFDDSIYRSCGKYKMLDLIRMSDMVDELVEINTWFPTREGIFDQHNGYGLAELLASKQLKQFKMEHFSDTLISDVYQLTKRLYSENLIEVPNHPVLVSEMFTLEAEKKAGQKVIVRQPNRRGAHNDISDAFVRAVWLCYNNHKERPIYLATGAGGGMALSVNRIGQQKVKQETQAAFFLKRVKMHGEHPRGLYSYRGRKAHGQMAGIRE